MHRIIMIIIEFILMMMMMMMMMIRLYFWTEGSLTSSLKDCWRGRRLESHTFKGPCSSMKMIMVIKILWSDGNMSWLMRITKLETRVTYFQGTMLKYADDHDHHNSVIRWKKIMLIHRFRPIVEFTIWRNVYGEFAQKWLFPTELSAAGAKRGVRSLPVKTVPLPSQESRRSI